jgi:hypothetical protein
MIVGQSIGTAATTGLAVIGGGLEVRRAVLAHVVYSLIAGVLAMLFLRPLTGAAEWVGSRLDDSHGVLARSLGVREERQGEQRRGHAEQQEGRAKADGRPFRTQLVQKRLPTTSSPRGEAGPRVFNT